MIEDTEVSTELETAEPAQTLDDVLNSAFDDIEAREEAETPKQTSDRLRDEAGRFAKTDVIPEAKTAPPIASETPPSDPITPEVAQAPNTWTPALKAKFPTLEPDIQQEIMKREKEFARALSTHDQDRLFGKSLRDVVSPYMPIINAEGSTPEQAIQSLLNSAYLLRTASPQEKGKLIANLAKQYGAELPTALAQPEAVEGVHPIVAQLQSEINQLRGVMTSREQQERMHQQQENLRQVEAFLVDPQYPYANDVAEQIAGLIRSGMATNLKDAYNQAIYLQPDVRQKVFAAQQAEAQRKQIEEAKLKAEQAKKTASVNLRAKPSLPAKAKPGTIQQTLEDTYDNVMGVA
jgi:hypothetical protein